MKKSVTLKFYIFLFCFILCVHAFAQQHTTEFLFAETVPDNILRIMETNANAVFAEIHRAFYDKNNSGLKFSLSNFENNEAIKRIQNLWAVSQFYCTETTIMTRVLKSSNTFQVRNIPVFLVNAEQEKDQSMVIEFTSKGKIRNIYKALPEHQYKKIMGYSTEVKEVSKRLIVIDFCENFSNAYTRKDWKFIEDVFSDDALIITGKVLRRAPQKGDFPTILNAQQIEYNTYNKQEYIANLRDKVFANNRDVKVKFDEIEVRQHERNPDIYGVTLKQYWNASNYQDEGWLFLMIDFKDKDNPLIWVRTWQPFEDPVTKKKIQYNTEDIFGLEHFPLIFESSK